MSTARRHAAGDNEPGNIFQWHPTAEQLLPLGMLSTQLAPNNMGLAVVHTI